VTAAHLFIPLVQFKRCVKRRMRLVWKMRVELGTGSSGYGRNAEILEPVAPE